MGRGRGGSARPRIHPWQDRGRVQFRPIIRSAIERQLEILGEALNRLRRDDAHTGARVPNLDKIIGMRNIISHEYGDIDYEIVWRAATTGIPALIPVLGELVDEARGTAGL